MRLRLQSSKPSRENALGTLLELLEESEPGTANLAYVAPQAGRKHRVVPEFEQREATNRATATIVFLALVMRRRKRGRPRSQRSQSRRQRQQQLCAGDRRRSAGRRRFAFSSEIMGPALRETNVSTPMTRSSGKKLLDKTRLQGDQANAARQSGGKGEGRKGRKAREKIRRRRRIRKPPAPFSKRNGACKKGANCDMSHVLVTEGSVGQYVAGPDRSSLANSFAAATVTVAAALPRARRNR